MLALSGFTSSPILYSHLGGNTDHSGVEQNREPVYEHLHAAVAS